MKGHELESFTHSKTKRSTNSIIHNSRPRKKAHEIDSKFERNIFSSPLYLHYYPTIAPYSIGVSNPIFDRNKIPAKYQNHVLGIRQGVLFHENNIFIFSPILQSDVVSNLMSVIYKESSCHSSIAKLTVEKVWRKQLKKEVSSIAMCNNDSIGAIENNILNTRELLHKINNASLLGLASQYVR